MTASILIDDNGDALAAIQKRTEELRKRAELAGEEYDDWLDALAHIAEGAVDSPSVEPSDGVGPPPPSEPAPSPSASNEVEKSEPAPPSRSRAESMAHKQRQVDSVVTAAREVGGPASKGDIHRRVDLSDHQVSDAIGQAVRAGRLEKVGKGAGTRYVAVETSTPVTQGPPPGRGPKPTEKVPSLNGGMPSTAQPPTLSGRILSACQMGELTATELVTKLGVDMARVSECLGGLVGEGELRTERRRGKIVYRLAA